MGSIGNTCSYRRYNERNIWSSRIDPIEQMERPVKALGTYQITYANGFTQVKHLVNHKELMTSILQINKLEVKVKDFPKISGTLERLKELQLLAYGSTYFTNQSPLFEAIENGILQLPPHQGGIHFVVFKKLN